MLLAYKRNLGCEESNAVCYYVLLLLLYAQCTRCRGRCCAQHNDFNVYSGCPYTITHSYACGCTRVRRGKCFQTNRKSNERIFFSTGANNGITGWGKKIKITTWRACLSIWTTCMENGENEAVGCRRQHYRRDHTYALSPLISLRADTFKCQTIKLEIFTWMKKKNGIHIFNVPEHICLNP